MAENQNPRARIDRPVRVIKGSDGIIAGEAPYVRSHVRGDREKDVAALTRDVIQGKADLPQLKAGLHRTLKNVNRIRHAEKDAVTTLLEANFLLALSVENLVERVETLENAVQALMLAKAA